MPATPNYHKHLADIEDCAGKGMTQDDIADYIGLHPRNFRRWCKTYPEVFAAYRRGRVKAKHFVVGRLFDHIRDGNIVATIFYLKTQCGWRETGRKDEDDMATDNTPFTLDEAAEDRIKDLIHESAREMEEMDEIRAPLNIS